MAALSNVVSLTTAYGVIRLQLVRKIKEQSWVRKGWRRRGAKRRRLLLFHIPPAPPQTNHFPSCRWLIDRQKKTKGHDQPFHYALKLQNHSQFTDLLFLRHWKCERACRGGSWSVISEVSGWCTNILTRAHTHAEKWEIVDWWWCWRRITKGVPFVNPWLLEWIHSKRSLF